MENTAKAEKMIENAKASCNISELQSRLTTLAETAQLVSWAAYNTNAEEHDRLCSALDVLSRELNICAAMAQVVDQIADIDKVLPTV